MMEILLIISFIPVACMMLYPLASMICCGFFRRPVDKSEEYLKPVTIIIACFNEERYIRDKINSFLHPDEWIEGSEIIVVSTGSTDSTNDILDEFADNPMVSVIKSPVRISKINAVNLAVSQAANDILVFSDCRQAMKRNSVKELVYNFNDPDVGTVASVLEDHPEKKRQSVFRRFINTIVFVDSQFSSGLNVYGALYAQRKVHFKEFPVNHLFDDLFVIVSTLSQGKRLVQERNAVIYDINFQSYYGPERLERLTRGLLIFFTRSLTLLGTLKKRHLLRFLVFKYAKLLLPFSFLTWLGCYLYFMATNATSAHYLYSFILITLIAAIPQTRRYFSFFVRMNFYFFIAFFKFFVLGRQSISWEKLANRS